MRQTVSAFPTIRKIPLLRMLNTQCGPGEVLRVDAEPQVDELPPTRYGTPRQRETFSAYAQKMPMPKTTPRMLGIVSRVRHVGERDRIVRYDFSGGLRF
ncbi:MAG: hypothetical protein ABIH92_03425 [Nanoarchaeota archaeon]